MAIEKESTATFVTNDNSGKVGSGNPVGMSPTKVTPNFPFRSSTYENNVPKETVTSSIGNGNFVFLLSHGWKIGQLRTSRRKTTDVTLSFSLLTAIMKIATADIITAT